MKTNLLTIPYVGKNIKQHLLDIGIYCVEDLNGKDPYKLYSMINDSKGIKQDKCLLYVFKMAVYYARGDTHDPDKLKWWYWKDK